MMNYSISQAAEKINVSTYTLRYYDKEGLLPMIERGKNGIRIFKEEDFTWLRLINCLKSSGMPIKDIKQFIDWYMQGDSTLQQRRDMFYERKAIIEQQIQELQKTLNSVKYKCWLYDMAVKAGTLEIPANMSQDEIPPEILELKNNSNLYGNEKK